MVSYMCNFSLARDVNLVLGDYELFAVQKTAKRMLYHTVFRPRLCSYSKQGMVESPVK
jgi:hypothetical protein